MNSEKNTSNEASKTTSNTTTSNFDETEKKEKFSVLAERVRSVQPKEDFASIFIANWQKIFVSCLAIVLGVWYFGQYKNSQKILDGQASLEFSKVQKLFDQIVLNNDSAIKPTDAPKTTSETSAVSSIDKKTSEAKDTNTEGAAQNDAQSIDQKYKTFDDNLKQITEKYPSSFYNSLSNLYNAQLLAKKGDFEAAKKVLDTYNWKKYQDVLEVSSIGQILEEDSVNEFAALIYARILLDSLKTIDQKSQDTPDFKTAKSLLEGLVKAGRVTNIEALQALSVLVFDAEAKNNLAKLVDEVAQKRIDLAEELKNFKQNTTAN